MALDISKIIQHPLKVDQFLDEIFPKTQIVIHHTAGNPSAKGCVDWWASNTDRVATAFVIAGKPKDKHSKWKDGDIVQCFSSQKWAYHLGIKPETFKKYGLPYKRLDKTSVGIEVCNWGYLVKGKTTEGTMKALFKLVDLKDISTADVVYRNYVGGIVPMDEVVDLGFEKEFKGYRYYHAYTDAQIASLKDLLIYLCEKYDIPKTYNESMWEISQAALNGTKGIWNHTSYRKDKSDMSPQPKLIEMLKTLETKPVIC